MATDLLGILKVFIKKRYFTETEYNNSLKAHKFKRSEKNDRPELIMAGAKNKKLKGKALSICTHIRNFGYILKRIIKRDEIFAEESYFLLLKLFKIVAPARPARRRKIKNHETHCVCKTC